ncbi:MAG TPA: glycosyltransferase family 4 protein [Phycisphaerae bacterium]|nr:glycosyltransferase family 4 protein [Phycisphaerae bacterium]HOB73951.1 glycosyltransferase family 4 protein [Phycisphaerae bacterium]HOJ55339.1 glycosyltransferase family 4 protein [Phycisphaerae bacterium]HOL25092.1 glycosyltransferase family 4 protein [Phycisphaerae bacterium]HPP19732.1 glycosyltransferase family 4 protein [Phycisphaerae bacterium]
MKITFINRMMGILRGGGECFDLNMARALQRLGAQVRFVVGRRVFGLDCPLEEFETHYIRSPYLRGFEYRHGNSRYRVVRSIGMRARRKDDLWFGRRVISHILARDRDTDVFQVCALAEVAARLTEAGRKAVVRFPGPPTPTMAAWTRRCSGCFTHGASYEGALQMGLKPALIVAGCDMDLFHPPEKRSGRAGQCRFIFVGRCIPVKNLDFLVDGFAAARRRLPELTLTIVGDGNCLPVIRRKVEGLGLSGAVEFPGFLSGRALADQYRAADCFTLVSQYESFSLVALEAMSSGLPLILSQVGHLPRFIEDHQAGTLVKPGDVAGLADAMVWWAEHPEARAATGCRNRATVEKHFSWDASARKLLTFYESLL